MVTLRFGLRKVARLLLVVLELRRSAKLERGPTILWVVHRWMDRIQQTRIELNRLAETRLDYTRA